MMLYIPASAPAPRAGLHALLLQGGNLTFRPESQPNHLLLAAVSSSRFLTCAISNQFLHRPTGDSRLSA